MRKKTIKTKPGRKPTNYKELYRKSLILIDEKNDSVAYWRSVAENRNKELNDLKETIDHKQGMKDIHMDSLREQISWLRSTLRIITSDAEKLKLLQEPIYSEDPLRTKHSIF